MAFSVTYLLRAAAVRGWRLNKLPCRVTQISFQAECYKGVAETGIMYTTVSIVLSAAPSTPNTKIHLSVLLLMAIFTQAFLAFVRRDLMSFSLFSTRHMLNLLKIKK